LFKEKKEYFFSFFSILSDFFSLDLVGISFVSVALELPDRRGELRSSLFKEKNIFFSFFSIPSNFLSLDLVGIGFALAALELPDFD
jgi:hypothetical protein